jgi:DNA polymerase-3 subunit epsilon
LPIGSRRGDRDEAVLAYLDLLARVLEDRRVDPSEGEALFELASAWGMTRDCIADANRKYLESLAAVALSDEVLTDSEHRDLCTVAMLLGIGNAEAERILAKARPSIHAASDWGPHAISAGLIPVPTDELRGKTVCFTGECQCRLGGELITRAAANELASRLGLFPANGVTKKLDLLVVADGFTESGKARKARGYGIRIVHESVFWRMIGVEVE